MVHNGLGLVSISLASPLLRAKEFQVFIAFQFLMLIGVPGQSTLLLLLDMHLCFDLTLYMVSVVRRLVLGGRSGLGLVILEL